MGAAWELVDAIPLPAIIHDADFRIIAVNEACRAAANLSRTYSMTRDVFAFAHPTEHQAIRAVAEDLLTRFAVTGQPSRTPASGLFRLTQDDNVSISYWTHTGLAVVEGVRVVVVALDPANPIAAEANVWRDRAERDDLTGLLRRNVALDIIERWLAAGDDVTVVFADVDHVKRVNDGYGHAASDAVLVSIADHLRALSHDDRVICRYAGDEFLIVSRSPIHADEASFGASTNSGTCATTSQRQENWRCVPSAHMDTRVYR